MNKRVAALFRVRRRPLFRDLMSVPPFGIASGSSNERTLYPLLRSLDVHVLPQRGARVGGFADSCIRFECGAECAGDGAEGGCEPGEGDVVARRGVAAERFGKDGSGKDERRTGCEFSAGVRLS